MHMCCLNDVRTQLPPPQKKYFNRYYLSLLRLWRYINHLLTYLSHDSRTTKVRTSIKFGWYIHSDHPNKSPFRILEKRERGCVQELLEFLEYPLLSISAGRGKGAMNVRTNFEVRRFTVN